MATIWAYKDLVDGMRVLSQMGCLFLQIPRKTLTFIRNIFLSLLRNDVSLLKMLNSLYTEHITKIIIDFNYDFLHGDNDVRGTV